MFIFKSQDLRAQELGAPCPLLTHIAGEFAPAAAAFWPHPHAAFLGAAASRRHLFCVALSLAEPHAVLDPQALLDLPLKMAIRLAAPAAPPGLARAMERLGERAWEAADYRRLVALLAGRQSCKLLRHREKISPDEVRALSGLPEALVEHGVGRLPLTAAAAGLITAAYAAIARRDGEATAEGLAPRWAAAQSVKTLVERIQQDLEPELPAPPFPGGERLRPLLTKDAVIDAAGRFKNCLRGQLRYAASGESAFYEWLEAPGAVLEITRDRLNGWSLEQARLASNKAVPEPTRTAIIAALRQMGVHVGRTLWQLDCALDDITDAQPGHVRSEDEAIAVLFGD